MSRNTIFQIIFTLTIVLIFVKSHVDYSSGFSFNLQPWLIKFLVNTNEYTGEHQICGGSLISKSWILTAASCFTGKSGVTPIQIILKARHLQRNISDENANVIIHPNYDNHRNRRDFALVKFRKNILDQLKPILLSRNNKPERNITGTTGIMFPFGRIQNENEKNNENYPKMYKLIHLRIISKNSCVRDSENEPFICTKSKYGDKQICFGGRGGSSLFMKRNNGLYMIGANSLLDKSSCVTRHIRFEPISESADWISHITGINLFDD